MKARIIKRLGPAIPPLARWCYQPKEYAGSKRDYQRFIVLSYARSGSTLLVSTLKSHPSVCCYSEVYNQGNPQFFVEGLDNQSLLLKQYQRKYPVDFMERFIFRGYRRGIEAVGFKIFPEQMQTEYGKPVLDHLRSLNNIKYIHVYRENYLRAHLSHVRAKQTGVWSIVSDGQRKEEAVRLDPHECEDVFEEKTRQEAWIRDIFASKDYMELSYEALTKEMDTWLREIQSFIGLNVENLRPKLVKQSSKPLNEAIENFEEIQEFFSATKWARFFDEGAE